MFTIDNLYQKELENFYKIKQLVKEMDAINTNYVGQYEEKAKQILKLVGGIRQLQELEELLSNETEGDFYREILEEKNTAHEMEIFCSCCGNACFGEKYPEIVFSDEEKTICEECSINYEEIDGKIKLRTDF